MAKSKLWLVNIDGQTFKIEIENGSWWRNPILLVNGKRIQLKRSVFGDIAGLEQTVLLGNKEATFVWRGSRTDIAIDGMYLFSKEPYAPLRKISWWSWFCMGACAAIPFIVHSGALSFFIGLLGARCCFSIAISEKKKTPSSRITTFMLTIAKWALLLLMVIILSGVEMEKG